MIQITNLNKSFVNKSQAPVNVLKNISLNLPDKGLVFILGKSGSGKTTLLNLLGGLDFFDHGDILINGNSTVNFKQSDFDNYRNGSLGFVFQDFNLIEDLNVFQNLALPLHLQGKKADPILIAKLLKEFELDGFELRKVNQLSGGQKQRIAIIRSIIKNPSIVLADEPTGNLDSETGKQVLEIFQKLSQDKLVIIVSHDPESAYKYGHRVIEMKDGEILSDFSKNTAASAPKKKLNQQSLKVGQAITAEMLLQLRQVENKHNNLKDSFIPTNQVAKKNADVVQPQEMIQISSHLPMKLALKMGISYFKEKKFTLAIFLLMSSFMFYLQTFSIAIFFGITKLQNFQVHSQELLDYKGPTTRGFVELYYLIKMIMDNIGQIIDSANLGMIYFILIVFVTVFFTIGRFVKQSIQFKKKEIGILRALGARGKDVFKIFFSEGFVIAILIAIFGILFFYLVPLKDFFINQMVKRIVDNSVNKLQNYKTEFALSQDLSTIIENMKLDLIAFKDSIIFYLQGIIVFFSILLNTFLIIFISIFYPIFSFARKKPIEVILNK
ncbi:MAG: ATP-binding cassette domain-containing protein [Candidatus Phytoplasma pyri]|uniref:ABC transporter ATP-binding protein/permease n=1 Tax=Candidatus Phytoplasma pyri TaxID=47566 RepID=UPI003983B729